MTPIEEYIRARAPAYGINPDIAVRVALSEGGLDNPTRQSDVVKGGRRERSYGPFQLLIDGGVGARALAAGIDPRKESDWRGGVDFALAEASNKGWGQWYGAKKAGIGNWDGIGGRTGEGPSGAGTTLTGPPKSGTNVFTPGMQTGLPVSAAPTTGAPPADSSILDKLFGASGSGDTGGYSGGTRAPPAQPMQLQVPSIRPHTGSDEAAKLMAQILDDQRKRFGLTITGLES
jgi:hypothetical protein